MRASHRRHNRAYFFKYTTAVVASTVLESRALRWSSPKLFNDPFDVPRAAELPFGTTELRNAIFKEFVAMLDRDELPKDAALAELMTAIRRNAGHLGRATSLEILRSNLDRMDPIVDSNLALFRDTWADMVPRMRILCLSAVNDSLPMWAHYCENHRGTVLQLASADERDSSLLLAEPVVYRPAKPMLPGPEIWARAILSEQPIDWSEYFRDYYYVKTLEWQYEQEWRVISYADNHETGPYRDSTFDPRDLQALFLGKDISTSDRDDILRLRDEHYPMRKHTLQASITTHASLPSRGSDEALTTDLAH